MKSSSTEWEAPFLQPLLRPVPIFVSPPDMSASCFSSIYSPSATALPRCSLMFCALRRESNRQSGSVLWRTGAARAVAARAVFGGRGPGALCGGCGTVRAAVGAPFAPSTAFFARSKKVFDAAVTPSPIFAGLWVELCQEGKLASAIFACVWVELCQEGKLAAQRTRLQI